MITTAISNAVRQVFFRMARQTCGSAVALLTLLVVGSGNFALTYEVSLSAGISTTSEGTPASPATCTLVRLGTADQINVSLQVLNSSTAIPADYTLEWYDTVANDWVELGGNGNEATSGTVTFYVGQPSVSIRLTPEIDAAVEGREYVTIGIVSGTGYVIGQFPSRRLTIADDDHKARIEVVQPVADEDTSLRGDPDDPISRRRAIVNVRFDDFASLGVSFSRNLAVQFLPSEGSQPTAARPADYSVRYRISGHSNWSATGTQNDSQLGSVNNPSTGNDSTTGLNFRLMAAIAGDTIVELRNDPDSTEDDFAVQAGSTIAFKSDPARTTYTVASATLGQIVLSSPLTISVPNGTDVIVKTVPPGGTIPSTVVVEKQYAPGSTQLLLGGGFGRLYQGDVIQLEGDPLSYVITADPVYSDDDTGMDPDGPDNIYDTIDSSGRISARVNIFAFEGGVGGGLNVEQTDAVAVTTLLTPSSIDADGMMQVLVPFYSSKLEISIEPTGAPDGTETAEVVRMRMIADEDYIIQTPQDASVVIADRDAVAGVKVEKNAGLPTTNGSLKFTLSKPYTLPVKVPFEVTSYLNSAPMTSAEGVVFETLAREVTFAPGQTELLLPVIPKGSASGNPATLTVTLVGTEDYKIGGSTSSGTNPSATMHINDVIGQVTITATTSTAVEATSPTNGYFRVSISRNPGYNGAVVSLKLNVSGTALNASRYEFFNPLSASTVYAVTSGTMNQIQIPGGSNFVDIGVRPIDNLVAEGTQSVQLTVTNQDADYTVGPSSSATVNIQDNEPTIYVSVPTSASRPSTAGTFRFSYPGTALNQTVLVKFTYSGATPVVDFAGASTATISPGSNYADVIINPTTDGTATSLTATVTPDVTYHVALAPSNAATMSIAPEPPPQAASSNKPTPGSVSSSSGGGCGLGSGVAGFLGLGLLLLFAMRRRLV